MSSAEPPNALAGLEPPTLQDVQRLTPQSDFSRFLAPGVDASVRNAALKKLFLADPHFKTGDELDTYKHNLASSAPSGRLAAQQLLKARALGLIDDELVEQPSAAADERDPGLD